MLLKNNLNPEIKNALSLAILKNFAETIFEKSKGVKVLVQHQSFPFLTRAFNSIVMSYVIYRRRRSVFSSFPCHQLFEAKFKRSSLCSEASGYPCMLFFASPGLFYLQLFLSITDVPHLSFCTNVLKTPVAFF